MGALKEEREDLFDTNDFNSIRIHVAIQNQTSWTSAAGDTRGFGEQEYIDPVQTEIRLMEFKPGALALDVPTKVAAVGHVLDVEIDVQGASLPLCFKVKGRVGALLPLEGGRERMDLEILEVNSRFYDALRALFQKRQEEIDAFLASMKH